MNVAEPYAVLLAKLFEPEVGSIVVHRASVPLDEQTVVVLPLVAHAGALFVLFLSQLPQHIHNVLRVLLRSLGLLCFRCVGIDTFLCRVVGSSADFYRVVLKIHVFPFQTEQLTAAVSAVNSELEEHPGDLNIVVYSAYKLYHFSSWLWYIWYVIFKQTRIYKVDSLDFLSGNAPRIFFYVSVFNKKLN